MTLRKLAGLLAAFGLTLGLIGGGVGAVFTDQVIATETINVGTFECNIVEPSDGDIALNGKSVSYTAPTVMSGAAGSAPFKFTVQATGNIPVLLSISHNALSSPFSSLGNLAPVAMDAGESKTYNVGLAWSDLNGFEGATLGITYTVNCAEVSAYTTFGPAAVTGAGPWNFVVGADQWGGVVFTSKTIGKTIGSVDYSFDRTGDVAGGAPRFSLPINESGGSTIDAYAFIDVNSCAGASTISTTSATCGVWYKSDPMYANWDAFAAAHPAYTIAGLPFVIMDAAGSYAVSNLVETVTP